MLPSPARSPPDSGGSPPTPAVSKQRGQAALERGRAKPPALSPSFLPSALSSLSLRVSRMTPCACFKLSTILLPVSGLLALV